MGILDRFKKTDVKTKPSSAPADAGELEIKKKEPVVKKDVPVKTEATIENDIKSQKEKRASQSFGVLIKPLITEKSTDLGQFNQYVFAVNKQANKIQIAQAIEERYGVKPLKVNIVNYRGKAVRYGRTLGRTSDWKKAIIILPAGKNIKIHQGV